MQVFHKSFCVDLVVYDEILRDLAKKGWRELEEDWRWVSLHGEILETLQMLQDDDFVILEYSSPVRWRFHRDVLFHQYGTYTPRTVEYKGTGPMYIGLGNVSPRSYRWRKDRFLEALAKRIMPLLGA